MSGAEILGIVASAARFVDVGLRALLRRRTFLKSVHLIGRHNRSNQAHLKYILHYTNIHSNEVLTMELITTLVLNN